MKDIGMSSEQLKRAYRVSKKLALQTRNRLVAYKKSKQMDRYQSDDQSRKLDELYRTHLRTMEHLRESGVVPWLEAHGMGNIVDDGRLREPEIWAHRVHDQYVREQQDTDGRCIQLLFETSHSRYTIGFTKRETVQRVIDQLTYELERWDEGWNGEPNTLD